MHDSAQLLIVSTLNDIGFKGCRDWEAHTKNLYRSKKHKGHNVCLETIHIEARKWIEDPRAAMNYIQTRKFDRLALAIAKYFMEQGVP